MLVTHWDTFFASKFTIELLKQSFHAVERSAQDSVTASSASVVLFSEMIPTIGTDPSQIKRKEHPPLPRIGSNEWFITVIKRLAARPDRYIQLTRRGYAIWIIRRQRAFSAHRERKVLGPSEEYIYERRYKRETFGLDLKERILVPVVTNWHCGINEYI